MTEPQPWPTTVQRRRGSDEAGPGSDIAGSDLPGSGMTGSDVDMSEVPPSDIPTPRHGQPADRPATTRVPSPTPRQRGAGGSAEATPLPETAQPYPQLPRPNPQVTREPSPPGRQDAGQPQPTHVRDLVEPSPSPARSASAPATTVVARDSGAMTALRVITYVLVSLASLVFLAFVVYGGIKYMQLRDAFSTSPFGSLTGSSASPNAGTRPAICDTDPAAPVCVGG
ncbi:MAG: hypothetical protein L0I76_05020 [Pseudonocardia sp.]|nr:hypothetical protein [Pseudonocardia sp.]